MAPPPLISPSVMSLNQLVQNVKAAKKVTMVFGAGVSVAMAGPNATWTAFLTSLVKSVSDRHNKTYCRGGGTSHWVGAEALEHRLHTIRSLSHGDSDAAVAATYLIDRLHAVQTLNKIPGPGGAAPGVTQGRNEDLNKICCDVEQDWVKRSATNLEVQGWNSLLKKLGGHARAGKAFLITTNFDHCVARAAELPIFLGGWSLPFNQKSPQFCKAQPEGVVIRQHLTASPNAWTDADILSSNAAGIAPKVHAQAWSNPAYYPQSWWQDLASVFHVHGSRLVPPSIVFDASSYSMLDQGTQILLSSDILRCLFSSSGAPGPIIFVGCRGTLLDPHFIQYWNNNSAPPMSVLLRDDDIDPLAREMHGHFLGAPPSFCSFGAQHSDLLVALDQIENAL